MRTSLKLTSQYHDRWLQLMSRLAFALLILALMPPAAHAQGLPTPPERMSYQGYLVDANGGALGTTAPKNYDVIFRIWNGQSAGMMLWAEQQTVTVDKGYFSVLLGEGSYAGGPHEALSSLFARTDASERYMEFTVQGIGSGGGNVTILPRLRLLTSPYAFLAKNAGALISPSGQTLVTADNGILTVHGAIAGGGTELTALNAGNIASGTLLDARLSPNVALRSGSNTFNGHQYVTVGGIFMDNDQVFSAKTTAGTYEGFLWPRAKDNASYLNYGANGFHIRNHDSYTTMSMQNNGDVQFNGNVLFNSRNVGIGTGNATPETTLEIGANSTPDVYMTITAKPDSGAGIRLRHGPNLGWTLQSDDQDKSFRLYSHNQVANGPVRLFVDRFSGFVGIGTTTPIYLLQVNGDVGVYGNVNVSKSVYVTGVVDAAEFTRTSDQRLKKDFAPLKTPLQTVLQLQGVSYNWRREEFPQRNLPAARQIGFVAQEVKKVIPEAVAEGADGYYSLNYDAVVPVLVEAMKEQQKDLQAKAKTIQDLERRLTDLEAKEKTRADKLAALESLIEEKLGEVRQASRRTTVVEAKN